MSEDHTLISIVDDDALARDGIRELVESLGYQARTFVSAKHFLESDVIAETSCLITDLQMPGLNGLELQETLNGCYRTETSPFRCRLRDCPSGTCRRDRAPA